MPVPIVPQTSDFSCGAAALLAVLMYWLGPEQVPAAESKLRGVLGTNPKEGTGPEAMVDIATAFGLTAQMSEGLGVQDLPALVQSGSTPILALQAWGDPEEYETSEDSGHWAVLVGIDNEMAWFSDPSSPKSYVFVPLEDLARRWHDRDGGVDRYGMAIVVKGGRPAVTEEPSAASPRPMK